MADDDPSADLPPLDDDEEDDMDAHEEAIDSCVRELLNRPLMTAIQKIVEERLRHDPQYLVRPHRGWVFFHAAMARVGPRALKYLVERCPKSVRIKTVTIIIGGGSGGAEELAVHRMLRLGALHLPAAQVLVEAWPASLKQRDARGRLPLNCALCPARKLPTDAIRFFRRSARRTTGAGSRCTVPPWRATTK
jgi:hypothetical protein